MYINAVLLVGTAIMVGTFLHIQLFIRMSLNWPLRASIPVQMGSLVAEAHEYYSWRKWIDTTTIDQFMFNDWMRSFTENSACMSENNCMSIMSPLCAVERSTWSSGDLIFRLDSVGAFISSRFRWVCVVYVLICRSELGLVLVSFLAVTESYTNEMCRPREQNMVLWSGTLLLSSKCLARPCNPSVSTQKRGISAIPAIKPVRFCVDPTTWLSSSKSLIKRCSSFPETRFSDLKVTLNMTLANENSWFWTILYDFRYFHDVPEYHEWCIVQTTWEKTDTATRFSSSKCFAQRWSTIPETWFSDSS